MRKVLLLLTLLTSVYVNATHIVGGELIYQHLGGSSYYLTVKLYKDCNPGTQNFPNDLEIEAFTGFGLDTIGTLPADDFIELPRLGRDTLDPAIDTCAFNPGVCVEEAIYGAIVDLPPVEGGYHLFYQTYARNGSLLNIEDPLQAGETFYAYIPDNSLYLTNSSPVFSNSPPVFVCQGYDLNLDFSATDVDGDSLVYSFYTPYTGRSWDHPDHYDPSLYYPTIDLGGTPPDNITFPEVVWNPGFDADNPLNAIGGADLTISSEGIINGIPEAAGQYVVGVMVEEYRDGVKIGEIVRDFQFNVLICPPPDDAGIGEIDGCDGYEIDFVNESGAGATDFWWDFGTGMPGDTSILEEPSFDYTPYAPETFTVTLIAQKGTTCADTTTYDLTLSGVVADFETVDTACTSEIVGFIDMSVSEDNGTITSWEWDFGDGTTSTDSDPTHTYGTPGDYTVSLIVNTDVGCADTMTQSIHIKVPPGAGIAPMMGCIGLDVDFTSSSDADATSFHWDFGTGDPGDTSDLENPSFTYPDYGEYTVTLITEPGTGCADTATFDILISNAIAEFEFPDTTCSDVLIDFIDLSTSVNGDIFSWEWDFGDGSSSTESDPSYGYTSPGTYTITLIVLSDIGCSDTVSHDITIYDAPQAVIGATDFCSGLEVDFINASDPGATDFWWDFGTGDPADSSIVENPTFTFDTYGEYTITLIAQKGSVCETMDTETITVSDLIGGFSMPDSVCFGTEVDFTDLSVSADGAAIIEWEWDFGDLITSDEENPTHVFLGSGDYTVNFVVHNDVGCTDTVLQDIYIQPLPTPFAGADTAVCLSDPVLELDGLISGADGGIWSGEGGTFSPSDTDLDATYFPTIDELDAGSTNLVLTTTGNGFCDAQSDTIHVVYLGNPDVDAGPDVDVCEDSTYVILDATVAFDTDVEWTTEGDGTFSDEESLTTIYTFGPGDIVAGTVTIYIETFNAAGCDDDSDTLIINFNEPPTLVTISDTLICSGTPLYLESGSSTENGIWTTNGSGLFDPDTSDVTVYAHGAGDIGDTFEIFFRTYDNGGCHPAFDTITVEVIPSPEANFTFDEHCFGIPTSFENSSTSDDPIIGYTWILEPGIETDVVDPTHTFTEPGSFDVVLIATSENGCIDSMIQTVRSHFIPVADFGVPEPCWNGGTAFFDSSAVGSAEIITWTWDFGDGSNPDTTQNPAHQYGAPGAYDITLSVTSEFGCAHDTTITVLINLGPVASFTADPPSANLFVDVNFTDQTVENGAPLAEWDWDFGDGDSSDVQNPVHAFDFEGEYDVELIVTDELGCVDTAYLVVPIYHGPLVPSAFSPNGDGNNDFLMILGGNFRWIDFTVYNNWGEIVFRTKDKESEGWDGTYKDEPQPLGVYVYTAKVITYDGKEHILSGDVSLIR